MVIEREAEIIGVIPRTPQVKSFRVEAKEKESFKAGQYLIVTPDLKENLSRPLSISNSPTEKGYLEFTKKITEHPFSQKMDALKPGGTVKIKYPYGDFIYDRKASRIAFLSGGIGITPIRSICKNSVDEKLGTDIILLCGNNTEEEIVFREDFEKMSKASSKLRVSHILLKPKTDWKGRKGLINDRMIQEEIPDYLERTFYVCGPPSMVNALKNVLCDQLGVSENAILTEKFTGYE